MKKERSILNFQIHGNSRVPVDIVMQGGRSDPRNAILHQMFSFLGFGERAGSGLYMISKVWKDKKWIKPEIKEELNPNRTILKLEMKKTNDIEHIEKNIKENLSVQQKEVLSIITNIPRTTQKQISEQLKITTRQVSRIIRELRENKIIERVGSDKNGYWKINI